MRKNSVVFPLNIFSSCVFGFCPPHVCIYILWKISDANTQILSGPLTLIRSLWCLEGHMVVVGIGAPGLTLLPIAGWLALSYEALVELIRASCLVGFKASQQFQDSFYRYGELNHFLWPLVVQDISWARVSPQYIQAVMVQVQRCV